MHDDLLEAATSRGKFWALVGVPVAAAGPGLFVGIVVSVAAGVSAGVVAGSVTAVVVALGAGAWLLAGAPGIPANVLPTRGLRPAGTEVVNIAEGIALATGTLPPAAWVVEHPEPNVAAVDHGDRGVLVVTSAALEGLTRDELEAVCAAQLAIARDGACRRLEGMLTAWRVVRASTFVVGLPLVFAVSVAPVVAGPVVALVLPAVGVAWLVAGKLRWWTHVAADGVCVATTRHPAPLVSSLRKLALHNGPSVPVPWLSRISGAGTARWAIPPSLSWTMTTSINGRVTDQRTAEQVEDVNLLVRAALVRAVCIEGGERSLASRQAVVEAVRRAGRAAAQGGAAEVEGVLVGLEGAVGVPVPTGTASPPGWYADPEAPGALRWWDGTRWTTHRAVGPPG